MDKRVNKQRTFWENLFAVIPSTSNRQPGRSGKKRRYRKLRLESLEDRSLLTAVGLSVVDAYAAEGTNSAYGAWQVSRSGSENYPCSICFRLGGTASSADYILCDSNGSVIHLYPTYDSGTQTYYDTGYVVIGAGSTSETIQLCPSNDWEKEQTETATLQLVSYNCGLDYGLASGSASISIEDNDAWCVSVSATDETAGENPYSIQDYGIYTFTRSNETDTTHPLSVRFQMTGTATPSDYTLYASDGSIITLYSNWDSTQQITTYTGYFSIPYGSLSATIELRPNNDAEKEQTETAILTLIPSATEYGYGAYEVSGSSASISIEDNDDWVVSVSATDCSAMEGNTSDYGVYTIARSNETDATHPLSVRFQMTGTALVNSDYMLYESSGSSIYLYSTWDSTVAAYIYVGYVSIPSGAFSTTVELRPFDDTSAEEDDETAIMSILPSDRYLVAPINEEDVTVAIEDNDLWKINVEAVDDVAKERLTGVAQDYGVYTFSKEYCDEEITGDDSYEITVNFDLLVYSYSCFYCALPGVDYLLSATALNADDTTVYLQNFSSVGMDVEQTDSGNIYKYHYRGTIPPYQNSASVRLQAIFDWLDEGMYYDLNGSPESQMGEIALLNLTSASWYNKGAWDALGDYVGAEVEIKDGALLELYLDHDGDGSFDIDESVDDYICFVKHNNDDDNENNLADKLEGVGDDVPNDYSGVDGEDELAERGFTPGSPTSPGRTDRTTNLIFIKIYQTRRLLRFACGMKAIKPPFLSRLIRIPIDG